MVRVQSRLPIQAWPSQPLGLGMLLNWPSQARAKTHHAKAGFPGAGAQHLSFRLSGPGRFRPIAATPPRRLTCGAAGKRIGAYGTAQRIVVRLDSAFLSGGAGRLAEAGVSAAALDAPSDRANLNSGFRSSPEHAQDIAALNCRIGFLNCVIKELERHHQHRGIPPQP